MQFRKNTSWASLLLQSGAEETQEAVWLHHTHPYFMEDTHLTKQGVTLCQETNYPVLESPPEPQGLSGVKLQAPALSGRTATVGWVAGLQGWGHGKQLLCSKHVMRTVHVLSPAEPRGKPQGSDQGLKTWSESISEPVGKLGEKLQCVVYVQAHGAPDQTQADQQCLAGGIL